MELLRRMLLALTLFSASGLLVAQPSAQDGEVSVVLSRSKITGTSGAVVIHFEIHNDSNLPIFIFSGDLPFLVSQGKLANNLFSVTDVHGKEAEYTGVFAKILVTPNSFIEILPGQSRVRDINLAASYRLTNGPVHIEFHGLTIQNRPSRNSLDLPPQYAVSSNSLDLRINTPQAGLPPNPPASAISHPAQPARPN